MSPTTSFKGQPTPKPSMSVEQRRRRNGAAGGVPSAAADAAESAVPAAVASGGADEPAAASAAVMAESAVVEEPGGQGDEQASLAIIGQELVAVSGSTQGRKGERSQGSSEETAVDGAFQTPAEKRPVNSPVEQLQLQNTPWNAKNDESGSKKFEDESQKVEVPNGPPVSYGPSSTPQLPLFSPEQVAQLSDARYSSSMLPLGREQSSGGDFLRVPGFLQGLFPGYDHVQGLHEARQKEFEWRRSMEVMVESLGLELRASRSENQRLREELHEARRDMSRYGTPEDQSTPDEPTQAIGVKG